MNTTDKRYPYTYAADYVRSFAGYDEHGTKLSRSDASQIRRGIAAALGMADDELARRLADYYQANESGSLRMATDNSENGAPSARSAKTTPERSARQSAGNGGSESDSRHLAMILSQTEKLQALARQHLENGEIVGCQSCLLEVSCVISRYFRRSSNTPAESES